MKLLCKHIAFTFLMICSLNSYGQQFQATVSKKKISNQQSIEYAIYSANIEGEIIPPSFKNFDIVSGPSSQNIMRNINGKRTTITGYSYVLKPKKIGKLSIAPASIKTSSQTFQSESFVIEVYEDLEAKKNNFARITASRNTLYPGQDLIVSFKIYTREQFQDYQVIDQISFDGFYVKQLDFKRNQVFKETINGKEYYVVEVDKAKLTPIKTGKISLKPLKVKTYTFVKTRTNGGGFFSSFQTERHQYDLQTNGLTINVKEFPQGKPNSFNGAIGNFELTSTLTSNETMANNAINYIITVKGKGNLSLIELPEMNFPPSFEVYDPEIKESNSQKTWNYLLIPKKEGEFQIPKNEFSYLDPQSNSYKSIAINAEKIKVKVDPNDASTAQSFEQVNTNYSNKNAPLELKPIESFTGPFSKQHHTFFGSLLHWLYLLLILFFSTLTLLYFNRLKAKNSDVIGLKKRGANKVAKKRLKKANDALKTNDSTVFYDELFNSFYGYIEDKFTVKKESLSKETISNTLLQNGIENNIVKQFIETISLCEMARFSPVDEVNKQVLYSDSVELISKIESKT